MCMSVCMNVQVHICAFTYGYIYTTHMHTHWVVVDVLFSFSDPQFCHH